MNSDTQTKILLLCSAATLVLLLLLTRAVDSIGNKLDKLQPAPPPSRERKIEDPMDRLFKRREVGYFDPQRIAGMSVEEVLPDWREGK